ncbi:hypothetical protein [Microbacterium lacticum]|uniref:DUF927 domain-containing protein n=1 Tax=Microbacterium lacticum TaxID=33885 RepID=A0A4Y3UKG5_9MICO|nr:hypothetical protein [Microbacterium lacticum]TQN00730.1 hypothetical protein FHX68_0848 [Microbacterium lacticum]GEB93989.1 hypothetical protein MLA01_02080 [Microbacterium lacticum]GGN13916.1 hypothetical protein GCM10009724_04200 [Microbacterium lacticum]
MSNRYDAFNRIAPDYDFRRTTEGAYVIIPADPAVPHVAESVDYLIPEWQERLAAEGSDTFGQAQVVYDMARAYARKVTQYQERVPLVTRVNQYTGDDGIPRVLIDLGDRLTGFVVQVGPAGWYVHDPRTEGGLFDWTPVWHREANFQPLPLPDESPDRVPGEAKAWFREMLALSDRDWHLVWLWLMSVYFPHWTQQGLMFVASSQMGKSLRSAWLLSFLHPADPTLGGIGGDFPTTERGWGSLMHTSPILAFDDVESISPSQHQAMKQVITGAAFRTQTLYETRGTTTTTGKRPLLITASGTPAGFRDDLRNRIWTVSPTRPPLGRDLDAEFKRMAPAIFADLLDDLVIALKGFPDGLAEMDALIAAGQPVRPREIRALARSLDQATGAQYETAMLEERQDTLQAAAEEDRFARVVYEFVKAHPAGGELSNDDLLSELRGTALGMFDFESAGALDRAQWFPQDTGRMGSWLGRKADSLASVGVVFHARRGAKGIRLRSWDPLPGVPEPQPIITVNVHPAEGSHAQEAFS